MYIDSFCDHFDYLSNQAKIWKGAKKRFDQL